MRWKGQLPASAALPTLLTAQEARRADMDNWNDRKVSCYCQESSWGLAWSQYALSFLAPVHTLDDVKILFIRTTLTSSSISEYDVFRRRSSFGLHVQPPSRQDFCCLSPLTSCTHTQRAKQRTAGEVRWRLPERAKEGRKRETDETKWTAVVFWYTTPFWDLLKHAVERRFTLSTYTSRITTALFILRNMFKRHYVTSGNFHIFLSPYPASTCVSSSMPFFRGGKNKCTDDVAAVTMKPNV
jgi:hypothetical protein